MCWTIKLHEAEHDIFEMYELSVIYDILYEKKQINKNNKYENNKCKSLRLFLMFNPFTHWTADVPCTVCDIMTSVLSQVIDNI